MKKTLLFFYFFFSILSTWALTSGQIGIQNANAPFFILDSNNPCIQGPSCGYIGITVTNTSGSTLTNVRVDFTSSSNANFYLTGNQPTQVKLYSLAPGQSATAYFYMKYSCTVNDATTLTYTLSDANSGTVSHTSTVYSRSSISANAGGQVISNTTTIARNNGVLLVDTVLYYFGNIKTGDEVSFGPCGNPNFNAHGLQLINCQIISSSVSGITAGSQDKLYYVATGNNTGSSIPVKIVYYFTNRLGSDTTTIIPYAGTTSGNTNYKYTGNYNAAGTSVFFQSNPASGLNLTKTANNSKVKPGDTVTYTVKVVNSNSFRTSFDYFEDVLPNGASYLGLDNASQVNSSNSGSLPTAGATGTLQFFGGIESSTFPYITYDLAGGDSLKLIYKVKIGSANQSRLDVNSARFYIGTTGSSASSVSTTVCPTLNTSNSTSSTICSGNTLNLTSTTPTNGTSPYAYAWSGPSSFTANTQNSSRTNIQTSHSGSYTVTVTDALTCSTSVSVTVTVNQTPSAPTISASRSTTFCQGDSTALSSSGSESKIWSTGATSSSIVVKTSGTYTVQAIALGCTSSVSSSVPVVVNSIPTTPNLTAAGSTTFCSGDSLRINSSAGSGMIWSNGTTNTFSIFLKNSGTVTGYVVLNGCTSSVSNAINVTVNPTLTPTSDINANSLSICSGDTLSFSSNNTNTGSSPSYQWFKNGVALSGNTSSTLIATNVSNGDQFYLRLNSNYICPSSSSVYSDTLTATVTNRVDPSVTINTTSPRLCNGYYVLFTSTSSNLGSSTNYQWFKNGNIISGATADTFSTTTLQSGDTISLRVQTNLSCFITSNTDFSNPIEAACVLPIQLISFNGNKRGEEICLKWESTGEESGSYYEIHGSIDGKEWVNLKTTPSAFIGKNRATYQNCLPINQNEYYRLSWVDANGSRSFGPVIILPKDEKMWSIAPNPAKQTIQIIGLKGSANVHLTNLEGKTVWKGSTQNQSLFWESLTPGMYFLQINQGNQTETHKLIITE